MCFSPSKSDHLSTPANQLQPPWVLFPTAPEATKSGYLFPILSSHNPQIVGLCWYKWYKCVYIELCIYIHISNFEYSRGREWQCISQRTDFGWHKSSDDSKYQRKIGKTACLKHHMPENLEMVQTYSFYWGLFPQWFLRTWWLSNGTVFNHPIQCQDSVVLLKAHQLTNHWRVPLF